MGLIVNADDFGISPEITDAILSAFEKGLIDRTTIMVNMPDVQYAVDCAKERDLMGKVGLHLNLTKGFPLSEGIRKDPIFCDPATGEFNRGVLKNKINRLYLPQTSRKALEEEIRAQIQRFENYGFTARHLDSHHHVHTAYPILSVLLPILEEEKWDTIRILKNTGAFTVKKRMYVPFINGRIARSKINCGSDCLYASVHEALDATINENIATEIEVHPQFIDGINTDKGIALELVNGIRKKFAGSV